MVVEQSLSAVKVNLNAKLQRMWRFNHIWCISLKDSENVKKSLYTRDKAEKLYQRAVIFRPSGNDALKTDRALQWKSMHVLRNVSENHCV